MFTTFGPGDSYQNAGPGISIGGPVAGFQLQLAVGFIAGFTGTLNSIRVGVYNSAAISTVDSFILSLTSDSSGSPGATLESFTGLIFPNFPGGILTVNSSATPALTPGSTYWIVLAATNPAVTAGGWSLNNQGLNGLFASRNLASSPTWTTAPSGTLPAVEVNAAAVPEPVALSLTLVGLAALVILRPRRARAA